MGCLSSARRVSILLLVKIVAVYFPQAIWVLLPVDASIGDNCSKFPNNMLMKMSTFCTFPFVTD